MRPCLSTSDVVENSSKEMKTTGGWASWRLAARADGAEPSEPKQPESATAAISAERHSARMAGTCHIAPTGNARSDPGQARVHGPFTDPAEALNNRRPLSRPAPPTLRPAAGPRSRTSSDRGPAAGRRVGGA